MTARLFSLVVLGFNIAAWDMMMEMRNMPSLVQFGMHVVHAAVSLLLVFVIVTGRAPD